MAFFRAFSLVLISTLSVGFATQGHVYSQGKKIDFVSDENSILDETKNSYSSNAIEEYSQQKVVRYSKENTRIKDLIDKKVAIIYSKKPFFGVLFPCIVGGGLCGYFHCTTGFKETNETENSADGFGNIPSYEPPKPCKKFEPSDWNIFDVAILVVFSFFLLKIGYWFFTHPKLKGTSLLFMYIDLESYK